MMSSKAIQSLSGALGRTVFRNSVIPFTVWKKLLTILSFN